MSERTLQHLEAAIKSVADPARVGLEVLESEQIKDYGRMIEVCNHFRTLARPSLSMILAVVIPILMR